jgi:hypothetical protein
MPEPAEDPWRVAFVEFKTRDENMVKDYQEEIDTLLVFVRLPHHLFILGLITLTAQAGLFSAVLTAFVVESYQSLQEDYTKTSADLLRQISHQLANASFPAAGDSSQFQAQRSDVRVNACWFVSLLLSLVVALFGIFLKQWIRTYMKWTDVTSDREAVAVRQFRYRSLEKWRLEAILALLPTLLQLSVILFLSGLLSFLWNLDRTVAIVMAVLLTITFFLVTTVTVLPLISKSCPYRSPLSAILAVSFWRVANHVGVFGRAVWAFIDSGWICSPDFWGWEGWRNRAKTPLPTSWVQADESGIAQYNSRKEHVSMHVGAMVHLCCTTQLQHLWPATIAAITAEFPADKFIEIEDVYYSDVWWPVLGHLGLFIEKDLDDLWAGPTYWSSHSKRNSLGFGRFSSSMKHCWVSFLLRSNSLVRQSRSNRVVMSYLYCCLAIIQSTTGSPHIMQAFMEVLEAQHANLEAPQLGSLAFCLGALLKAALLQSLLGLSFLGMIAS